MSDVMRIQPFATQLARILMEYERHGSIFDIHKSLFYTPAPDAPFAVRDLFGHYLATPIGPSAGPHTQLSQNIIAAYLCGGRFMELKTVQVQDDLTIPRPCIDMTDEGYNVEWSQELRLEQSAQAAGMGAPVDAADIAARCHLRHERGLQPGWDHASTHDALHGRDGRRV